jgi:drug/metabolite transporter (DMT)-like permease
VTSPLPPADPKSRINDPPLPSQGSAREVLGLLGFLVVASAQVSNMILARGVAGSVPPFSIAFFRWGIVALGLLPVVVLALREKPGVLRGQWPGIVRPAFSACSSVAARSTSPA